MSSSLFQELSGGKAPSVWPLTVDQLDRMIEAGILREGDPVELIDGVLVRKDCAAPGGNPMVHSPRHASVVSRLQRIDRYVEAAGYHVRTQLPVTLSSVQQPEPDAAVVHGTPDAFAERHPGPSEIAAVMEVADSSVEYDRTTKQRLYASANIPQYWIVNVPEGHVELYDLPAPANGRYGRRRDFKPGEALELLLGSGHVVSLPVGEILVFRP